MIKTEGNAPFLIDFALSALRCACAGFIDFSLAILRDVGLFLNFRSSNEVVERPHYDNYISRDGNYSSFKVSAISLLLSPLPVDYYVRRYYLV